MSTMREEWRPIPGWPYEASSEGRIRRAAGSKYNKTTYAGRVRVTRINVKGYPALVLTTPGKRRTFSVHNLVALAFFGPRADGLVVNHIDGDTTNNRPGNLEYVTPAANEAHAVRLGLKARGVRNTKAKLTPAKIRAIRSEYRAGGVRQVDLAERFGVNQTTISLIVRGELWSHVQEAIA